MRWTDDTQMTIDVAESLIARGGIDQADLASRFAASYRWNRGYGPGTAAVLRRIRNGESWESASFRYHRHGSYGNGAAMRAPVVGIYFRNMSSRAIAGYAHQQAVVTHAHHLAREGAALIAVATAMALAGAAPAAIFAELEPLLFSPDFQSRLAAAAAMLSDAEIALPKTTARKFGNSTSAHNSCVTALYIACALRDRSFSELMTYAIRLGGDVDTIAAMAGALWGAANGAGKLPSDALERLENLGGLSAMATRLHAASAN